MPGRMAEAENTFFEAQTRQTVHRHHKLCGIREVHTWMVAAVKHDPIQPGNGYETVEEPGAGRLHRKIGAGETRVAGSALCYNRHIRRGERGEIVLLNLTFNWPAGSG